MDDIKLSPQELADIKDDITFRVKTTTQLKTLCGEVKRLCDVPKKVSVLETKVNIQWFVLTIIVIAIIGTAIRSFAG